MVSFATTRDSHLKLGNYNEQTVQTSLSSLKFKKYLKTGREASLGSFNPDTRCKCKDIPIAIVDDEPFNHFALSNILKT